MKKLLLNIKGQEVEVQAMKISGQLWFHYQGETHQYAPQSKTQSQSGAAGSGDPTKIVAPMPGKVLKILKSSGQVAEGETVVVMEAMKMEYNLKATQDMSIAKVSCREGDNVSLGDLLVELEES